MLKKSYRVKKQNLVKTNFIELELFQLIKDSLSRNNAMTPLDRISYNAKTLSCFNPKSYFSTYQKLLCFYTDNYKVTTRDYNYSRFFLNKQLNKILLSNTFK